FLRGRPNVHFQAGALLGELLGEASVADEDRPLAAEGQVAGVAAEAGQVGDVDGVGDEVGVEVLVAELAGQAVAAAGGVVHERLRGGRGTVIVEGGGRGGKRPRYKDRRHAITSRITSSSVCRGA